MNKTEYKYSFPDANGKYGIFGGKFVPETLIPALEEIENVYNILINDKDFLTELEYLQNTFNGRPTPLTFAERLTKHYKKGKIYFKREDLNHTGAHKINNTIGQILIAKYLNKKRIIAETGAGQHGVATATVCAKFGLECCVYMGEEDIHRQKINVQRMEMLGAKVIPVISGNKTLKDATNEAIRDWVTNVKDTFYIIGSVVGPHPYPMIVRNFQSIIGDELIKQINKTENRNPDYIIACVGGGSNAMGIFYPFINSTTKLIGVEAAGEGIDTDKHCATLTKGTFGVFHGMHTYLLQSNQGQVNEVYSISAGLDYPGVGPEHSYLHYSNKVKYVSITDEEAIKALKLTTRYEGILPALETSHALAYLEYLMPQTSKDEIIVVNISGRGDKDLETIINFSNGVK